MSIEPPTFNNGGGSTECAGGATVGATENALTQGTITIPEAGLDQTEPETPVKFT